MSEPIPLLPVGPILTVAILLLAAIAKAGEFEAEKEAPHEEPS